MKMYIIQTLTGINFYSLHPTLPLHFNIYALQIKWNTHTHSHTCRRTRTHAHIETLCWWISLAELAEQNKWLSLTRAALTGAMAWHFHHDSTGSTAWPTHITTYTQTYKHSTRTHTLAHASVTVMSSGSAVGLDRRGKEAESMKPSRALAWLEWCWLPRHTQCQGKHTQINNNTPTTYSTQISPGVGVGGGGTSPVCLWDMKWDWGTWARK